MTKNTLSNSIHYASPQNKYQVLTVLIFLILNVHFSFSQIVRAGAQSDELKNLKTGKTFVVKTNNEAYDAKMKTALETYWKINSYELIGPEEIGSHLGNASNYILSPYGSQNDKHIVGSLDVANYLVYFCCDRKKMSDYTRYDFVMDMQFVGYSGHREEGMDYIINSMNSELDAVVSKGLAGTRKKMRELTGTEISKMASVLKGKTLLIPSDYVNETKKRFSTIDEDAFKAYSLPYKMMPFEEIVKLMNDGDKNYCFLQTRVGYELFNLKNEQFRNTFIYDFESKKIVYLNFYDMLNNKSKFDADDFKSILNAINGKKGK